MNFKQTMRVLLSTTLICGFSAVNAAEGVSFYYGAGLGAMQLKDKPAAGGEFSTAGVGEIFVGFEERGWAFEISRMASIDASTTIALLGDVEDREYSASGDQMSLSYRTVERNGIYYKIKYGKMESDTTLISKDVGGTDQKFTVDDTLYGVGMGMRINREDRLELEYAYFKASTDYSSAAHIINLRYIFGGSKP
ncbi:MAG: porin family protein [Gammaproteobacteria bacterium]|nr:porin family protein [Gammaproteobacteria bacterium]